MYTIQSRWTQVREDLDVTTVIFDNRSYAILNMELSRTGAGTGGPKALSMLDLAHPDLDFARIATGMGVDAVRVETAEDFTAAFERAMSTRGQHLIDAVI
jgi:acetolactate synthase-1/2/3 large subunit